MPILNILKGEEQTEGTFAFSIPLLLKDVAN